MTEQMQQHLTANSNLSRKNIVFNNFLGGLAWGFGSVVGATIVVGIIGAVLRSLGFFNTVNAFLSSFGQVP